MKRFNPMLIIPHVREMWYELADLKKDSDEVGNGVITITQGGVSKGTFTTNQSDDTTIEVDAGGGGADLMVPITHADLLSLVNNSELVVGQQYRITDYVATVDESVYNEDVVGFSARSNNHAFDIIVTADSVNQLNENARAIRHEGDTYFPLHTKFEAWKLKYTIFNDSDRFDWAVSEGKGVVYQLIDEVNNDLPYDFKSIQFQRDDVWVYTFGGTTDDSLEVTYCYENKMKSVYSLVNSHGYSLNNNTFRGGCHSNNFERDCYSNTFGNGCYSNTFGNGCYSNTFEDYSSSNTFGSNCHSNTFKNSCNSNTFGSNCHSNTFGSNCHSNTFGINCNSNTFGINCHSNTLRNYYDNFNVSSYISNIDFSNQLENFTIAPNNNVVNVIKTSSGAIFSQVINATTTEAFDV